MNFKGNQRFRKGRLTLLTFKGFSELIYLLLLFKTNCVSVIVYPFTQCDLFDDEDLYNEKGDDFHSIPQWLQNGLWEMKLSIRTRNVKVFAEKKSNCTPPFTFGQLPSLSLSHSFNFHFSISLFPFPQNTSYLCVNQPSSPFQVSKRLLPVSLNVAVIEFGKRRIGQITLDNISAATLQTKLW